MAKSTPLNHAFSDLYLHLKMGTFHDTFTACTTDAQRLQICKDNPVLRDRLSSWMAEYNARCFTKSIQQSAHMRAEGNNCFKKRKYKEALECYTQSILLAPFNTDACQEPVNSLAIGYANRSAVFYYLKKYKLCLEDIARAIGFNYPTHLLHKVYVRRANCQFNLQEWQNCAETATVALRLIDEDDNIPANRKDSLKKELHNLISKSTVCPETSKCDADSTTEVPEVSVGEHAFYSSASCALDVLYSPEYGRHIVANEAISAGTTLIAEKPFAAILVPAQYNTHCHHCYAPMEACVPCPKCSQASYCSENCQKESFDKYHQVECCHLSLLHDSGLAHLVLRIILTSGLPYLLKNRSQLELLKEEWISGEKIPNDVFKSPYLSVFSLTTNSDKTTVDDMLAYCICANMLLELIDDKLTSVGASTDDKLFVGSLMIRHIQQLICNAHAITQNLITKEEHNPLLENKSQTRIASAVYPLASLFNHSCDPTIMLSYVKDVLVARSIKDVAKGEQIFCCYGPHFSRMSKSQRQDTLLQQYFFVCKCDRCEEDNADAAFKEHISSLTLYDASKISVDASNVDEAVNSIEECIKSQSCILYKHHADLSKSMDLAARCYAMQGLYEKSAAYIRPTLQTTERKYGSSSIELAHELQKFTDVLWRTIVEFKVHDKLDVAKLKSIVIEASVAVEKGRAIYNIHYGPAHSYTKEMCTKQECLKNVLSTINE